MRNVNIKTFPYGSDVQITSWMGDHYNYYKYINNQNNKYNILKY